jgi:hypothetical protein
MRPLAALAAVLVVVGAGVAATELHSKPAKPPIVFVVFDALPGSMLMKADGQIDAERFPGFAELARRSTWYPNATTVHDRTIRSIPAMLDGRWPTNTRAPLIRDHPLNLFTLLQDSYRVYADEEGTQLCPLSVCRQQRRKLGPLLHGGREQRFAAALSRLGGPSASKRPQLWFVHLLFPHEPLRYFPSGTAYEGGVDPEPALDGNESFDNEFLTRQSEQRHLLQLEYTDTLIQRLLARLRATGLYDKALIVVTADHGISFQVKSSPAEPFREGQIGWRRDLTRANGQDVAFVPLFVKTPGQRRGATDNSWVRTLDILPTILRAAHVKGPSTLAGHPLGEPRPTPKTLSVLTNRAGLVKLEPKQLIRGRAATLAARARRFGTGADVQRLFRIGPHPELLGRATNRLVRSSASVELHARFRGARRFLAVDTQGGRVPANVIGWLDGQAPAERDLAVAVNGRIAAVGKSFEPIGKDHVSFSLLVPETAFRDGYNDVRLYEVRRGAELAELGRSPRL